MALLRWLGVAVVLATALGCSKKPAINEVVATVEASAEQLNVMRASAAERKGKDPGLADMPMTTGPFVVKFKSGTHKVIWTLEGEQAQAGPVDATIAATLGDESGGRVMMCRLPANREFPAGATRFDCESAPFRVEADKTFVLKSGLSKLQGFTPNRMSAQVAAVPVSVGWGGWFSAMVYAMVGVVMLGLWFVFFKR
jgi:hypothetical protein